MDNRDNILEKIRKCMALAKSATGNEAETALRQAKKLMEAYQVSHAEMLAIGVKESQVESGAASRPAAWESELAGRIAGVFGCHLIYREGWDRGLWSFIGLPPANEVAAYSFTVLFRQAKKARQEFIAENLKRFKKANKVRRADLFCEGWVRAALRAVAPMTQPDGFKEAIDAYVETKFKNLGKLEPVNRNKARQLSHKDEMALAKGADSGRNAQLNKGVSAGASPLMLEAAQ
jgi:hypothetical protein